MNIHFSQVREDPAIEVAVCNMVKNDKLNILMIGSGGCTLFTLLNEKVNFVHVVDYNQAQLNLIMLKLEVICYLKDKMKVLDFLEGRLKKDEYTTIYENIKSKLPDISQTFWNENMDLIYKGVNTVGCYEQLFTELVESKFDFKAVFNKFNLASKFGKKAVDNCDDKFSEYFEEVFNTYKNKSTPDNNYFYHQVLHGKYSPKCLPAYFDNLDNIIAHKNKITLINSDIAHKTLPSEEYDVVQISNIADWMSPNLLESFLQKIYKALKKDGFIIARRLLGSYNLKSKISEYFSVVTVPEDRSYFYSEVVVGRKV